MSPMLFANSGDCKLTLSQAHEILGNRLKRDDFIRHRPPSPFSIRESPRVELKRGELLKAILSDASGAVTDSPRVLRAAPEVAMSSLARALNDRLFVVQDFVLYAGDKYREFMSSSLGINPAELEFEVKTWIHQKYLKAVNGITRSSILNYDQLADAEVLLNDVAADVRALASPGELRQELLERFDLHKRRDNQLADLGVLETITGFTKHGEPLPQEPERPYHVPRLVPLNWAPQMGSDFSTTTRRSRLLDIIESTSRGAVPGMEVPGFIILPKESVLPGDSTIDMSVEPRIVEEYPDSQVREITTVPGMIRMLEEDPIGTSYIVEED